MPVEVWRETMDLYFPGSAWLRLDRETFERLYAYRARKVLPSWEETARSPCSARRANLTAVDPCGGSPTRCCTRATCCGPTGKSALKNQRRWTFGGVYPRAHSAAHPDDPAAMRTQCLVEGGADAARRGGRALPARGREPRHARREQRPRAGGRADGRRRASRRLGRGDRARDRVHAELVSGRTRRSTSPPAGARSWPTIGRRAGMLVRSWRSLSGRSWSGHAARARASPGDGRDLERHRLRGRVTARQALRRRSARRTPILEVRGGAASSRSPTLRPELRPGGGLPERRHLAGARGRRGERHTLLSSPIILPDYPEIAPESPGDLFDGGEIDQLLVLNILSLTDEEKQEMRAADPKGARDPRAHRVPFAGGAESCTGRSASSAWRGRARAG